MKKIILVLGCVVLLGVVGQSNADLVFMKITPCRIIDTRVPNSPITTTPTSFVVAGTTGFEAQGGQAVGCGIPAEATAVMINFIAANPQGPGNLRAWPFGTPEPTYCSIINYTNVPGLNIANGVVEPICDSSVTTCTSHLTVRANVSSTHLVADVMGYFWRVRNMAIVAPSGGDYTSPVDAMNALSSWCGTPSSTNTCLLKIMPGTYNIGTNSIHMQQYVDVEGSGENATIITGHIDSNISGVVDGASNAEIRFLTVQHTGGGNFAWSIYNTSASPKITNVTASSSGGTNSWGVYDLNAGTIRINHSVIKGSTNTVWNGSGVTTYVGNSQLDGGPVSSAGTLICAGVYDENYTFYASTCP